MSASAMLKKILQDNRFTPENVSKLEGKLFYEGAQTVIATWLADSGNEQELESVKVFGNAMNITLSGTEDLLAVDELGQALQDMNAHIDDVTVKINQAKEIPVLTDGGENE